jgi:uncharacterized membrane protein
MRGSIVGFDADTNSGAIIGHDGGRYDFVRLNWRGAAAPSRGTEVDFVAEGVQAIDIVPTVARFDTRQGDTAQIVYILYLVSFVTGVTGIIGLIMAYVNRAEAPEWVQSHYRFQIRTFWIGCLYWFISLLTAIVVIGVLFGLFTFVWWIVRCAKGLKYQSQGMPYPNAATWLW